MASKKNSIAATEENVTSTAQKDITRTEFGNKQGLDVAPLGGPLSSAVPTILVDKTTTASMVYYGFAAPGTATSAASWKIMREDKTGSVEAYKWAASVGTFSQIWDNRASLSYG